MAALTLETLDERVKVLEDKKEGLLATEGRIISVIKDHRRENDESFLKVRAEIAEIKGFVQAIAEHFGIETP